MKIFLLLLVFVCSTAAFAGDRYERLARQTCDRVQDPVRYKMCLMTINDRHYDSGALLLCNSMLGFPRFLTCLSLASDHCYKNDDILRCESATTASAMNTCIILTDDMPCADDKDDPQFDFSILDKLPF